jgi:two-component system chemotaxis sensor kinase CheA
MSFQSQVLNQLQRSTMKMRMVPVEQLFRRFPRLARDIAKVCGKDVALVMSGQETDLDKGLLDALAEPLAHVVRNAVDHGIETPAERKAAGKSEQGTIRMHAWHEANQVVIEVSDDGRGIDAGNLLSSAVAQGVVSADKTGSLSRRETLELIFEPGLSTAPRVTEVSGRGVGMDVVKATVQKLKGTIAIETQPGQGTKFALRLPLTLAIIRAMLFRVGERTYAAPLESVREIARAAADEIHRVDNHEVLQLGNEIVTVVRLNRLVAPEEAPARDRLFVIVMESGERKFGLLVDGLVGEEELVIKPLDERVIASEVVSGASVRGDGAVVLILNVNEVTRRFAKWPARALEAKA